MACSADGRGLKQQPTNMADCALRESGAVAHAIKADTHTVFIGYTYLYVHQERDAFALAYTSKIWPAQLSCLGGSVGRASARYAVCHGFEYRLRQLLEKKELSSGPAA